MNAARLFHLGDVLSITTGRLVSPRHMQGVYEILDYMTGDKNFTHQLPRVSRECAPVLLEQHPQLKDVDASRIDKDNWQAWLAEQVARFGEQLQVRPVPAGVHTRRDPIAEAEEMLGPDKVIVVRRG